MTERTQCADEGGGRACEPNKKKRSRRRTITLPEENIQQKGEQEENRNTQTGLQETTTTGTKALYDYGMTDG